MIQDIIASKHLVQINAAIQLTAQAVLCAAFPAGNSSESSFLPRVDITQHRHGHNMSVDVESRERVYSTCSLWSAY